MKFHFKIQPYQTEAVESVVQVFAGQPRVERENYVRDKGTTAKPLAPRQMTMDLGEKPTPDEFEETLDDDTAYRNHDVEPEAQQLLANIQQMQLQHDIPVDSTLSLVHGRPALDVEMETGTGKTYCYIKTMFELHKRYGWGKFIIVVPSVAIREGVAKTFRMTEDHFMQHYGHKARWFVYDSKNLHLLDTFAQSACLNVMIINMQAFNTSLKEGSRDNASRIMYSVRDEFGSRRPIDVLAATRPVIILDEPQKMGGKGTMDALKRFRPLFFLHYSATHKEEHNKVYALDAVDAYNKRLVKKIQVKGIRANAHIGTGHYLYLDDILLSPHKPPMARMQIEVRQASGVARKLKTLGVGDNLYHESNGMSQYRRGYVISDIDPLRDCVTLQNGTAIYKHEGSGDMDEAAIRRLQIRETIASHFEKEKALYSKGIKVLSLFFIDEVAKYRQYDEEGNELLGEYGRVFEEEYRELLNEQLELEESAYKSYLLRDAAEKVHCGYFSIDRQGHSVDSKEKRGEEGSDDISAYDLILRDKERLLSFEEPTRFIFSHSALREGWDNPNVFQICTLKTSANETARRQEVGRGLRLAVNQAGERMDEEACGEEVHTINKLTMVTNESYTSFVQGLQDETRKALRKRPIVADTAFFEGKIIQVEGKEITIAQTQANQIVSYLADNDYVDGTCRVLPAYFAAKETNTLEVITSKKIQGWDAEVHRLMEAIADPALLDKMIEDGGKTQIRENKLNENFLRKEFMGLWERINPKYTYTVRFNSEELVKKAVDAIERELHIGQVLYSVVTGEQVDEWNRDNLTSGGGFETRKHKQADRRKLAPCTTRYDLTGKIAEEAHITRRTAATILCHISAEKLGMFAFNPESFIANVSRIIREQKAALLVDHITYDRTHERYDASIFTAESARDVAKAFEAKKSIQPYIFTDGMAEKSVERRFAESLDTSEEVCVYAKLPRTFKIPTPVGDYAPDWAIAFNKGKVRHIYFIAETKGSMSSLSLRGDEAIKINCVKKLFESLSTQDVRYDKVDSYDELLKKVMQ